MCEAALGPAYEIVELGLDVPFQGARIQPWHRDFPSPEETWRDRRITSLVFNLTGVDVTPDLGPFEIAPGVLDGDWRDWKHEMFPASELWPRFAETGVRKVPKQGDISCRSALTSTLALDTTRPSRGRSSSSAWMRPARVTRRLTIRR